MYQKTVMKFTLNFIFEYKITANLSDLQICGYE